jgi:membrane-bound lytic murein transglycosylase A
MRLIRFSNIAFILLLAACSQPATKPAPAPCDCPPQSATQPAIPVPETPKTPAVKPAALPDYSLLQPASWDDLHGFSEDDLEAAWSAWLQSCSTLINRQPWLVACAAAAQLQQPGDEAIASYFRQHFNVFQVTNTDGGATGLITGYYQPVLQGSRTRSAEYRYPLYSRPDDLITVELAGLYPELAHKRIRGRFNGQKLVPYYSRSEIDIQPSPLSGRELVWVDDIIDLFFLQIQGSGIIELEGGKRIQVGYADQNGHAYRSIGRVLIERGEIAPEQASMQGIKQWARSHPQQLRELLDANPSYVFFRELPAGLPGPLGALGVPVTAERSVAIDPRHIPLGAPVFLATTYPNSSQPLNRLMLAQDTGGAIKGGVRADFYWGAGDVAGQRAGAMKQSGKIWVLLPKDFVLGGNSGLPQ